MKHVDHEPLDVVSRGRAVEEHHRSVAVREVDRLVRRRMSVCMAGPVRTSDHLAAPQLKYSPCDSAFA